MQFCDDKNVIDIYDAVIPTVRYSKLRTKTFHIRDEAKKLR